jgi:hypothetical protein
MNQQEEEPGRFITMEEQPKKIATTIILSLVIVACLAYGRRH